MGRLNGRDISLVATIAVVTTVLIGPAASAARLPDLKVKLVTFAPAVVAPGDQLSVTDKTANIGRKKAPPSSTGFSLSTDMIPDPGDVSLGSRLVPALARRTHSTATTPVMVPAGISVGNYFVIACA